MLDGKERRDRRCQLHLSDDLLLYQLILLLGQKLLLPVELVLASIFGVSAQFFCFQVRRQRLRVIRWWQTGLLIGRVGDSCLTLSLVNKVLKVVHLQLAVCGDQQVAQWTHHDDLMLLAGGLGRSLGQIGQGRRHSDTLLGLLRCWLRVEV